MPSTILFESGSHRNVLLEDFLQGEAAVQANLHLIIHGKGAMILDPGGHKVYSKALSATMAEIGGAKLTHIFLSHEDPDIVAAVNGWLMTTDAVAYSSDLWMRFIPHFGLDRLVVDRLKGIPDRGMLLDLDGLNLMVLPAHFLHSSGNHQIYDPESRILYSGDLGGSLGVSYQEVSDFDAHIPYMRPFHQRYMASGRALKAWAAMARQLDVEVIAPQHGAFFRGKEMVARFIDWCDQLEAGVDLLDDVYQLPTA